MNCVDSFLLSQKVSEKVQFEVYSQNLIKMKGHPWKESYSDALKTIDYESLQERRK